MVIVLLVIFIISAILLILVIMLQDDQGDGLGGIFGGGSSSAFGSRSGNVLTRVTSVLAAIFLVTALAVAWLSRSSGTADIEARARIRSLEEQESSGWYIKSDQSEDSEAEPETEETVAPKETSEQPSISPEAPAESD